MNTPASEAADTPQRILEIAEQLVQTRGFNGFSYADIAAAVGLTKATLHCHFATKAELGRQLIERYAAAFEGALRQIDAAAADAPARLRAYVKLYADVLAADRMCLCGMAAAEYGTLPAPEPLPARTAARGGGHDGGRSGRGHARGSRALRRR